MTSGSASDDARFPWGYFVATLVPVILISLLTVLPLILAPEESMGWLMLCSLLIGPVAAIPEIEELNIGHHVVSRAVFVGLDAAIRELRAAMDAGRRRP